MEQEPQEGRGGGQLRTHRPVAAGTLQNLAAPNDRGGRKWVRPSESPRHANATATALPPGQQPPLALLLLLLLSDPRPRVVAVEEELAHGGEPGPAHPALPRVGLGGASGAGHARADRGRGVQAPHGPAPGVGHAPDLAHLRRRQHPRVGLDLADRVGEAPAPREVGAQLRHADGLAEPGGVRRALRGGRGREVLPELLHHALAHHVVHAAVQVLVQHGGVHVHPEEAARQPQRRPVQAGVGTERVGGRGGVVGGVGEERVDERVGAPGDDGHPAARRDGGGDVGGQRPVRARRELARVGADGAQEVVQDAAAVRRRHLVGGDVEAGVELYLVGVHDLAAQLHGRVDGQLGLARARGAHDHHQRRRGLQALAAARAAAAGAAGSVAASSSADGLHSDAAEPPRTLQ
ncbi:hypothetical protein U9M48_018068 [Paspalum notatum var. saurae]|uniref:Uncharacterized protein n=1 Tax=Paspalum notatum var. saurae TaxID=547442 RepID=A0AAQ3T8S5_PASNO